MLYDDLRLSMSGVKSEVAAELIDVFGSARNIFAASKEEILSEMNEKINTRSLNKILAPANDEKIEKEIDFIERYSIRPIMYGSSDYSENLAACFDPPSILYVKGEIDFNLSAEKWVAVVGTRKCTPYGIASVERIIAEIAEKHSDAVIVSGLAYGIDVYAHRAAIKNGLKTVAVMAHGLDTIYPSEHRDIAKEIITKGGAIVTEFPSESMITKYNFLTRNRIVAGLSQSLIMAESPERGGSMVTASLADGYGREVFAFPARTIDKSFSGNLRLLSSSKANILTSAKDIETLMNWQEVVSQKELNFTQYILTDTEQMIFDLFEDGAMLTADEIVESCELPVVKIMSALTSLEFKELIRGVKGKMYIKCV